MRTRQRWRTISSATLCAAIGLTVGSLGYAAASDAEVSYTVAPSRVDATPASRDLVIEFHGRVVTLRTSLTGSAQLSISRAVPGDLVSLTDRLGRVWTAKVQPGATSARTPWVPNAVRGEARTVDGRQLTIPIP